MSKSKMFAMIFLCGICFLSANNLWAAEYSVTVANRLHQTGDAKNVDSSCYPVTLAVHSSSPVQTFSLMSPLKGGKSDAFKISVSSCDRLQLEVKCHWWRPNTPGLPVGQWLDTSATANWDCASGTANIEVENGQLRVASPLYGK